MRLAPLVDALPETVPFVGPEALERRFGRPFRARLGANELALGPPAAARRALRASIATAWRYGDPEGAELKAALAAHLDVAPGHIVLGEGIDGLLSLITRLIITPGDAAVSAAGAYPTFAYHLIGAGGRLIAPPYLGTRPDAAAMLAAVRREGARIFYLSNPDNPMGSLWPAAEIAAIAEALPEDCLFILDEAYAEGAPEGSLWPLAPERPNLLRLRSFSKAYGLAGLRIGYGIGPASLIRAFDKLRNHFGLGGPAQAAALAALGDKAWPGKLRRYLTRGRAELAAIGAAQGLTPLPSATNFVTFDTTGLAGEDGGVFAEKLLEALLQRGVFLRKPQAEALRPYLRISLGRAEDHAFLAQVLPGAIEAARKATA